MATVPRKPNKPVIVEYPTSDGRPMAETDLHRDDMVDLIQTLKGRYAGQEDVYVSGNLLLYYEERNKRKHVSPDVFVVKGVGNHRREYYLLWEEKKGPDLAIEVTSKSTRAEDLKTKFALYRDALRVGEYFLFDPRSEYLDPPLQGFRLHRGEYVPIRAVGGRLPSKVLGLHLEKVGTELRLYDPVSGHLLPTLLEAKAQAEAEVERLRRELETLRGFRPPSP